MHLAPESVKVEAVETPHYLYTLLNQKPLIKEGMLTVTAHTEDGPLVMANLFTTTPKSMSPKIISRRSDGFVSGSVSGKKFAFSTSPGHLYHIAGMTTDALAMTWNQGRTFIAMGTVLKKGGKFILKSDTPATFILSADSLVYDRSKAGKFVIGRKSKPSEVILNGKRTTEFSYDKGHKRLKINIPKGEGSIIIK
jgi:hypothetical protein